MTAAAPVLCRDFARTSKRGVSIVGTAAWDCATPVQAGYRDTYCSVHIAMFQGTGARPVEDEPADDAPRKAGKVDPQARKDRDEARAFLTKYTGQNGFMLDLLVDYRRAPAKYRFTAGRVRGILGVKAQEAQAAEQLKTHPHRARAV